MWPSDVKRIASGFETVYFGAGLVVVVMFVCGACFWSGVSREINAIKESEAAKANEAVVPSSLATTSQTQSVEFTFVLARVKGLSNEEAERIFAQFKLANPVLDCWYDMADRGEDRVIRVHVSLPPERK